MQPGDQSRPQGNRDNDSTEEHPGAAQPLVDFGGALRFGQAHWGFPVALHG